MTQDEALEILKTGANVFLTGEPGSGKTYTINRYTEYLREHGIEPAITASTGIAATHIGGQTIHSWSGIGIRKVLAEEDLDQMAQNERLVRRVSRTNVLIIDEISMLDALTLKAVDDALRALRRNESSFGGMQVIFVGDFFQLPPISRFGERQAEFAFRSPSWANAEPLVCYLSEQHRQDEAFLSVLTSVRRGDVDDRVHEALSRRMVALNQSHKEMTKLYAHNQNVDGVNNKMLSSIHGDGRTYKMESRGGEHLVDQLKRGCLSPEILILKKGARVMCTKNNPELGFVNGTLGEVSGFDASGNPIVRTTEGQTLYMSTMEWTIMEGDRTLATIIQIPLRLAWAITIHKSQGMTLDSAVMDLSGVFEYGQGYVALSRVRSLEGLYLLGIHENSLRVHPEIVMVDKDFRNQSETALNIVLEMSGEERQKMKHNFIVACGGNVSGGGKKEKKKKSRVSAKGKTTYLETLELLSKGGDIKAVAKNRSLTIGTIYSHVEKLYMSGALPKEDVVRLLSSSVMESFDEISSAFKVPDAKLTAIFENFGGQYSYDELRLVRMLG